MPGPLKQPTPDGARPVNVASLIKRAGPTVAAEVPDPTPYQSRRVMKIKSDGNTLEVPDTYWTKNKLMQWLAACPRVMVSVPLDPSNDPGDPQQARPHQVIYDGYRFDIPKGEPVEVPSPIAEIVQQGQQKFRTAQSRGLDMLTITPQNPNGMYVDFGDGPSPSAPIGADYAED